MSDRPEPDSTPDSLMQEAASWFARMRGPDAAASHDEFEAWLRRGALHRAAYNRAAEIFAMGKLLGDAPAPVARRKMALLVPLAAVLSLTGAGWLALRAVPDQDDAPSVIAAAPAVAQFATTSETRLVRLADGSRILLGPQTALEATLDAGARNLRLLHGQARFEVFHEARPFTVEAGGGRVTARGTLFEVAYRSGAPVSVRLIQGAIDVALPRTVGGDPPVVRRLGPGEAIHFAALARNVAAAPDLASDVIDGTIEFTSMPLGTLLARANRESDRTIRLAEPGLDSRRVSGRLRLDDPVRLAGQLGAILGLEVDSSGEDVVLRTRGPRG